VNFKSGVFFLAVVFIGTAVTLRRDPSRHTVTPGPTPPLTGPINEIGLSGVTPGRSLAFPLAGHIIEISVPAREGHTFGSFHLTTENYSSGATERDGSLQRVLFGDVTADGTEDAVIVIQSGGSGSYATVFVLESMTTNFHLVQLPEFSAPGYMGHDRVSIRNGSVVREFPTYVGKEKLRIDRQWKTKDTLQGKLPVRNQADSNATPSGANKVFRFDFASNSWIPI
tara:strand:+ start:5684 stop:6361 length:678 start_codon:yes stop_codon:yes gene_type:complete